MNDQARILVVEDDQAMRETCCQALGKAGYDLVSAASPKEAEPILLREDVDLVVTDLKMPHGGGQEVLRTARKVSPHLPVILITAYPSVQSAVDMFKGGVADYLSKPFTIDQLRQSVRSALQTGLARDRSELLRRIGPPAPEAAEFVGSSPRMRSLLAEIRRVAALGSHVLILGESGSGKELAARTLHRFSNRSGRPFVSLNCASVSDASPAGEKGVWEKSLEEVEGGSLFLDEVTDLPASFRAKLLGLAAVEPAAPGSGRPGGGARILAATFKDLREEVRSGRFREDVFYHLSGLEIRVPPLREHLEDVPALAVAFLDRMAKVKDSPEIAGFSEDALEFLSGQAWPGNVRELENTIRKALSRAGGPLIRREDLAGGAPSAAAGSKGEAERTSARDLAVNEYERKYLAAALADHSGNISHTSKALGIHRTTLQRLMKKHGIVSSSR